MHNHYISRKGGWEEEKNQALKYKTSGTSYHLYTDKCIDYVFAS